MKTLNRGSRFLPNPLVLICLIFLITIGAGLPQIQAEIIGLTLDNSCKTLLKNNMSTNCPTYEMLNLFYNDLECGYYDKVACLDYYDQHGITDGYIIDPAADVMRQIKLITIRSNFEEYLLPDDGGYNDTTHTISYGLGRYVDSCRQAYVDSKQWFGLVGDTIMYLDSGCTKTNHIPERFITLNQTVHNIADSYKWKLEQWQKQVISSCGSKLCLYDRNQTSPP